MLLKLLPLALSCLEIGVNDGIKFASCFIPCNLANVSGESGSEWSSAGKASKCLFCPSTIRLRIAMGFLILTSIENRCVALLLRLFFICFFGSERLSASAELSCLKFDSVFCHHPFESHGADPVLCVLRKYSTRTPPALRQIPFNS